MISDIDEFPRPTVIHQLKQCGGWEGINHGHIALKADANYYGLEFKTWEEWFHPNLAVYSPTEQYDEMSMRWYSHGEHLKREGGPFVFHGAWHCTYCFAGMQPFINKLESFSHEEHNNAHRKDPAHIRSAIERGVDLFSESTRPRVQLIPKALPGTFVREFKCYAHFWDRKVGIVEDGSRVNWWEEQEKTDRR